MNLAELFTGHPAERLALVHGDRAVSYGELDRSAAAMRDALTARGVGVGDRVVCICGNEPEFVVAYLGALGCGAVFVPLNPVSPQAELERQEAVVTPSVVLSGAAAIAELIVAEPAAAPIVSVPHDAVAALLFTSGTAGAPLAAMLSHGNLRANIEQTAALPDGVRPDDVVLGVLPLFHVFGLNVALGQTLAAGARLVLVDRFDATAVLDVMATQGVTVAVGAPPMWHAWAHSTATPERFGRIRLAMSGADRLPEETSELMAARFGVHVGEGYGLTEASPVVTSSIGTDAAAGSIGRPLPGIELRVVDPDGDDVLVGDPGEIWVRGPNVFLGYWGDPGATARAVTPDGWLRTGDLAVVDEDGSLRIVDRTKDLIIVSGFNVHPGEVEEVVRGFPGVADVAVIGVPDPHTGEAVKAFVVLEDAVAEDLTGLVAHCGHELARYKCPSSIEFVPEVPRGVAGKVLRRQLRG